jgi:hypothetical protein
MAMVTASFDSFPVACDSTVGRFEALNGYAMVMSISRRTAGYGGSIVAVKSFLARAVCAAGTLAVCTFFATSARGQVVDAKTGHAYLFVSAGSGGATWSDAASRALALRYKGMPGHLAVITSESENAFLIAHFPNDTGWIGGVQAAGSAPNAGWQWVTGEKWGYTHWILGEPNDNSGTENEDRLQWYRAGWNDSAAWRTAGFFVEFEPAAKGRAAHPRRSRRARKAAGRQTPAHPR